MASETLIFLLVAAGSLCAAQRPVPTRPSPWVTDHITDDVITFSDPDWSDTYELAGSPFGLCRREGTITQVGGIYQVRLTRQPSLWDTLGVVRTPIVPGFLYASDGQGCIGGQLAVPWTSVATSEDGLLNLRMINPRFMGAIIFGSGRFGVGVHAIARLGGGMLNNFEDEASGSLRSIGDTRIFLGFTIGEKLGVEPMFRFSNTTFTFESETGFRSFEMEGRERTSGLGVLVDYGDPGDALCLNGQFQYTNLGKDYVKYGVTNMPISPQTKQGTFTRMYALDCEGVVRIFLGSHATLLPAVQLSAFSSDYQPYLRLETSANGQPQPMPSWWLHGSTSCARGGIGTGLLLGRLVRLNIEFTAARLSQEFDEALAGHPRDGVEWLTRTSLLGEGTFRPNAPAKDSKGLGIVFRPRLGYDSRVENTTIDLHSSEGFGMIYPRIDKREPLPFSRHVSIHEIRRRQTVFGGISVGTEAHNAIGADIDVALVKYGGGRGWLSGTHTWEFRAILEYSMSPVDLDRP